MKELLEELQKVTESVKDFIQENVDKTLEKKIETERVRQITLSDIGFFVDENIYDTDEHDFIGEDEVDITLRVSRQDHSKKYFEEVAKILYDFYDYHIQLITEAKLDDERNETEKELKEADEEAAYYKAELGV